MIAIENRPADTAALLREYPENSVERNIIQIMADSGQTYRFSSKNRLKFELNMRREIVDAAYALDSSQLSFEPFRNSFCNTDYWVRTQNGGFSLKSGVKPSDAVRDIFQNSSKYGTECATAMLMVYYKALVEVYPEQAFNDIFRDIYLMNWNGIDPRLREVGLLRKTEDYLPGDRRYFRNPDVDPTTPEWQGENVIDLGGGLYYGHGAGTHRAETFIQLLNKRRRENADDSAYLLEGVGRPNFNRLADLYDRYAVADISYSA